MAFPAWMSALNRKLLRDLWHIRGQAVAIALVMACGVGMYVMSSGMLVSLDQTRQAYYERYRFADVVAPVKRAPQTLEARIANLPGVRQVETRIRSGALLDVDGVDAPITGQLMSIPEFPQPHINDLVLRQGRYIDAQREDEVLVLEAFAQAHSLKPGDSLHAVLNGTRKRLHIAGVVLSPEFVYAISPGDIVPDPSRFGVLWMGREALAHAFDLDGAFNEALIQTMRHTNEQALIDRLDALLEPYGAPGAYGRDQQISDQFLSNEIDQLRTMAHVLPPIFLLVAGFLLHVVLSRLIDTEREQIGLLKAFGYGPMELARHYLRMTGVIALAGTALGMLMGLWLGHGMATLYMAYFKFPFLSFHMPPSVLLISLLVSIAVAALGTLVAIRRVMKLQPAVAMVPPAPADYSRTGQWLNRMAGWLDQPSRMIVRHLQRWPARAAMTTLGIAMAMGLLIGSSFSLDASRYMVDVSFNVIDRQDITVSFVEPRSGRVLHDLRALPGVIAAEPFRATSVTLSHGRHQRRQAILGLGPEAQLSRVVDSTLNPVTLPEHGIALSDKLAELLQVTLGDELQIAVHEGRRPVIRLPVSRIVESYIGTTAVLRLDQLNRLLGEDDAVSGAYLMIDQAHTQALYDHLKNTPAVAGLALQGAAQTAFNELMQQSLGTFVFFNTLFAGLIAVGVVYNSARVSLSERGRELASLRVLGLTRAEVSFILLGELALLTLLALPLGAALGYALAWSMVQSLDTDLFRIPLIIYPSTYGYAVVVVVVAALASGLLVRRRIDRLDLIAVLKTRE